jgi:hypothetical protein
MSTFTDRFLGQLDSFRLADDPAAELINVTPSVSIYPLCAADVVIPRLSRPKDLVVR